MATVALSGIITPTNVVTATSTTTLTNKTISGASNTLTNIPLSSAVTGTLPIASGGTGTTSTTFVNAATNVTGTLPIANGGTGQTALSAVSVGTSTNLAGGSNGTIPYQSAAGTTQMLAVGTAGQVLQTNGAGAPTWVTPGGGSLILVQSVDGTGVDVVDLTGGFTSTYDFYKLYVSFSATTNNQLYVRFYINGTLYSGTNYAFTQSYTAPGQSNWPISYASAGSVSYIDTYVAGKSLQFEFTFFQPSNSTNRCSTWWLGNSADGPPTQTVYGTGAVVTTGTAGTRSVTGVQLNTFGGTGNWTARLYGIKKS